jgi:tRNA G37 N-methylase Trm5
MLDEIWAFRKYDYFGHRVALGEVVVDIGAHIGTFAFYAAGPCQASKVISFEPHPDNFRLLERNVSENRLPETRVRGCRVRYPRFGPK